MDIPRGGCSLSIHGVSRNLFMVSFLLINSRADTLEIYRNDECRRTIDVIHPLACCSLRKERNRIGPVLVLADEPHRIEKIHTMAPL